jgi:protein tyrosine/serine phosphatase
MFNGTLTTLSGRARAWSDSMFVDHAVFRTVWSNWAVVEPGILYRFNHPTPWRLRQAKARHGLRTLINLRGHRKCGSDARSRAEAERLGLIHIDAPLESRGAPHRDRILRLAETFATMQVPAVMHCKSGADRTGLAAGLFILMRGGTAAQALEQLSWRYGHFNRSRTGILDAFFVLYQTTAEGRLPFLDWVRDEYDEAKLKRDFVAHGLASFINDTLLQRE